MMEEKPRILIVDDVPKNIQVLGGILMKQNYNIAFANNGTEALEIAANNRLDLILLDVMMPGIDGFETCSRLKNNAKTKDIPVIFMTALNETSDKVRGFKTGAVDFITKPYEAEEVLARVETHLTLQKLKRDLQTRIEELEVRNNFIRRTFGRYLSEEVVASLLEKPDGLKVGGQKLNVTILMSDIRGFSAITEKLAPEQVVSLLNIYLSRMTDIIVKYEGTIDEFIGDGILVIFGAPVWKNDHAERAVACALEMLAAIEDLNKEFAEKGLPEIEIGIGVNTGEVIVGNIGSQKRAKYGVVGRTVNVTSRIESYTVGGQLLVSEGTRQTLKDNLAVRCSMTVNPKGIAEPMEIFHVTGIGNPYNIYINEKDEVTKGVKNVPVKYIILDDKSADQDSFEGELVRIGSSTAEFVASSGIALYSNLKINISGNEDISTREDLYAKVTGTVDHSLHKYRIHFTYLPDEFKNRLASFTENKDLKKV